jgi:hypothetical protein
LSCVFSKSAGVSQIPYPTCKRCNLYKSEHKNNSKGDASQLTDRVDGELGHHGDLVGGAVAPAEAPHDGVQGTEAVETMEDGLAGRSDGEPVPLRTNRK